MPIIVCHTAEKICTNHGVGVLRNHHRKLPMTKSNTCVIHCKIMVHIGFVGQALPTNYDYTYTCLLTCLAHQNIPKVLLICPLIIVYKKEIQCKHYTTKWARFVHQLTKLQSK